MSVTHLTVLSGQAVSSAFALTPSDYGLAVSVPSHAATWGAVRVEFCLTSGTAPFAPLWVAGVASANIFHGAGPGWGEVPRPPSPYGRVTVTHSTAATMSFAVLPVRR